VLPAGFLALLTFWSGTFSGGATFAGAATTHACLLTFALLGAAAWRDPLGLGRFGRWLAPALLLVTLVSWLCGPVPRAGVTGVVLLPAYLLIPAAVTACWTRPRERRLGLWALGLVVGLVATLAVLRWQIQSPHGAAMPLGNKNLLAGWLVILWPVGLASLSGHRLARIGAALVGVLVVVALVGTDSLLAAFAVVVQALLAAMWWKRARVWAWLGVGALVILIGLGVARAGGGWASGGPPGGDGVTSTGAPRGLQRTARVVSGTDRSLRLRVGYARAGWLGLSKRPLLGWGPGSASWTGGQFLEPVAGLNPASEVVGDLHSWPVQLGYEMGFPGLGLVAAIGWLFTRRRRQELAEIGERVIPKAALLGLAGGAVYLVGNAPVAVVALPAALAVIAGVALAGTPRPLLGSRRSLLGFSFLYVVPAVLVLLPLDRAHLSHQRALGATTRAAALAHVRRAQELDSRFPLYQARAAWLTAELAGPDAAVAEEARRAAAGAQHLAPLWLAAGTLAVEAALPWAEDALERARQLDPLAPLPAFHLLRARPEREDAVELGVSAVRGDRRLARAVFWDQHPRLRATVLANLKIEVPDPGGSTALLVQSMDTRPAIAFSLFAFRRSMWPVDIAAVEVYR
jgi:hypothetical protein